MFDGATFWGTAEAVDAVDSWTLMPAATGSMSSFGSIVSEFESSFRGGRSIARLLRAASALQGRYGRTKVATGGGLIGTLGEQGNPRS